MKVQREEGQAAQFQKLGLVTVTSLAAWAKNAGWELTGEVYSIYLDVWEAKGKPRIVIPSTNLPASELDSDFLIVPFEDGWYESEIEELVAVFAEDAGLSEDEVLSRLLQGGE